MIMIVRDKRHSDRDKLTFDFQTPGAQKKAKTGGQKGVPICHTTVCGLFFD